MTSKRALRRTEQRGQKTDTDLARLREATKECASRLCICHRREWAEIETIEARMESES